MNVAQRFDLPLVEQSLTLVSAYGTYIITEDLGGSGVIGVVTTGLILGNFGSRIGMNPRTRVIVTEFWEFLAFFVNSIVFLLIGDQIHFAILGDNLQVTAITVGAMIVTRALTIFVLGGLSNRLVNQISIPDQTVLWWGGLRGAVSIALALSVPTNLPGRETLIAIVFGAVLFTLLVQGLTIQPLLKRLQLLGDQPARQRYLEVVARQSALNRVLEHLSQVEFCRYQETLIRGELECLELEIDKLQDEYPNLQDFIMEQLRQELLLVEANTYAEFVRNGRLNRELSPFLQEVIDKR
jgi:monovalent cation:H+ antiporter, CPA1 family